MQTNTMFFVMDFGFDENKIMRICGAFGDYSSALSHANSFTESIWRRVEAQRHSCINDDRKQKRNGM